MVLKKESREYENIGTQLGNKLIPNKKKMVIYRETIPNDKKWYSIGKQIQYQTRKNGTQKGNKYQMRKIDAHEEIYILNRMLICSVPQHCNYN